MTGVGAAGVAEQAAQVWAALAERRPAAGGAAGGCVLVALDGRAGAGKTTLAEALARTAPRTGPRTAPRTAPRASGGAGPPVRVVHGDDFFRPMPDAERLALDTVEGYGRYLDWRRLRDQLLVPLSEGRPARYRPGRAWADPPGPGPPREVPCRGTVLVEGVLTARPELAGFYDLTVFLDAPAEVCLRRLLARAWAPGREAWIARWRAVEDHYLATTGLPARAGLTVRA
ncbi:uridine kinase [Streptomyces sp. NPDC012888]|uniref:uridine kinase family protein n=1 Tax=Streptomyces sp. NPDC012888 TaxID=3364855 RepID=UPI0036B3E109